MFAWAELGAFLMLLTAVTPVLGGYIARVFEGPPGGVRRFGERFELLIFRVCRVDPSREMKTASVSPGGPRV